MYYFGLDGLGSLDWVSDTNENVMHLKFVPNDLLKLLI